MYKFLIASILVLISSCKENATNIQPTEVDSLHDIHSCNCGDLILDSGFNWYYLSDRLKPFTGKCYLQLPDGSIILERNYEQGKVHGDVLEWHNNGTLKLSMKFEKNRQVGEMKEWDNEGILEYHATYNVGKMDSLIYKRIHYVN